MLRKEQIIALGVTSNPNHQRAWRIFEHDSKIRRALDKAAGYKFSDEKYHWRQNRTSIISILESFLYEILTKNDGEKILNIEDYDKFDSWIYRTFCNLAEEKRLEVIKSLGIKAEKKEVDAETTEDDTGNSENSENEHEVQKKDCSEDEEKSQENTDDEIGVTTSITDDIEDKNDEEDDTLAKKEILRLISMIPHKYYQEILIENKLYGWSSEELAEKYGKTPAAMNSDVSRAMTALFRASEKDILKRQETRITYKDYRQFLPNDVDEFLYKFLIKKIPLSSLADEFQKPVSETNKMLENALKALYKIEKEKKAEFRKEYKKEHKEDIKNEKEYFKRL